MKKLLILASLVLCVAALLAITAMPAGAAPSSNAFNQGTCTAHTSGMPTTMGGHMVPGLAYTPFSTSEVPGHDHAPDPPGC